MSNVVAEIAERIQTLSTAQKQELLHVLLQDIDGADLDADEAWR